MNPAVKLRNPRVVAVEPEPDYLLRLTFANGEVRRFDMKGRMDRGILLELRDPKMFNAVKAYHGTVHWPNDADYHPDTLYECSVAA